MSSLGMSSSRSSARGSLDSWPGSAAGQLPAVAYGTPVAQLERLFPGWHMHIVELRPDVALEEF